MPGKPSRTQDDWKRVIDWRTSQLAEIFELSAFPSIGELQFLWPSGGMLKSFLPDLKVYGHMGLGQQGIFAPEPFWPVSCPTLEVVGATRWVWGYAKVEGWTLAEVSYDMKKGCHTKDFHQCPAWVNITARSFEEIVETGFSPEIICNFLGQRILVWSEQQNKRAKRARSHEEDVKAQEMMLAALR